MEPLQEEETPVQVTPEPLDERAAKWVQDNPWFVEDIGNATGRPLTVHDRLIKSGVEPRNRMNTTRLLMLVCEKYFPKSLKTLWKKFFEEEKPKRQSNVVAPPRYAEHRP